MRITVSTAVSCAREAVQDFRLYEYLPFGFILAAQLLFLFLTVNLGTTWGMATAGWVAIQSGGDRVVHYPEFFIFLPNLAALVEAILYTLAGSFLIPLAIARIMEPTDPALQTPGTVMARVKRAVPPVLVGALLSTALLAGWQYVLPKGPGLLIRNFVSGGPLGETVFWLTGMLVAYAVSACFLCIPVIAVQDGRGFAHSLITGFKRSLAVFPFSYSFVVLFSAPALLTLYVAQVFGRELVTQMRPEVAAVLLCAYVILINLGTYFLYGATTRLLIAGKQEAK